MGLGAKLVERRGKPPRMAYRWDPETDILTGSVKGSAKDGGDGLTGSVELEGSDGSFILLDVSGAVWDGDALLVVGSDRATAQRGLVARYTAGGGTWRVSRPSPTSLIWGGTSTSAAWTGRELVLLGSSAIVPDNVLAAVAYDPATDRWRHLPPSPLCASDHPSVTWTGRVLVVAVRRHFGKEPPARPVTRQMIQAQVPGDGFQPTADRRAVLQFGVTFVGLQENFLRHIFGFGFVAEQPNSRSKHHVLVGLHERLELLRVYHRLPYTGLGSSCWQDTVKGRKVAEKWRNGP